MTTKPIALTVGSLFTGIGGMDLGFERAGFSIRWMCEIDPFCKDILRKHWPKVPIHDDVTLLKDPMPVDCIIGGFPCQDIAQPATGWQKPGVRGRRSGLWREYVRIIRLLRPDYVVVENVGAIRYKERGFGIVLGDLARIGYDAEWRVFEAGCVGAPHRRARLWLVAYPNKDGESNLPINAKTRVLPQFCSPVWMWPNPPGKLGMANGIPDRLDRVRALGNAVVPQAAQYIAECILYHATNKTS